MFCKSIAVLAASLVLASSAIAAPSVPGHHKGAKSKGGIVASDGSIVEGTGFSVSHDGTGEYTLDVPGGYFKDCPVVLSSGAGVPTHAPVTNNYDYITCGSGEVKIQIRIYSNSGSGPEDSAFHFLMIDP
jgi:hypothetical protein